MQVLRRARTTQIRRYLSSQAESTTKHYDVVVVGGGCGGLSVSSQILSQRKGLKLAIIEPSKYHYYQPGWTMVGGGIFRPAVTRRNEVDYIPEGADWIKSSASSFEPEKNIVVLADGHKVSYNQLVIATGLKKDFHFVKGLSEALEHYRETGVCSNYSYEHAPKTFELMWKFRGGNAVFTCPSTPIACLGAAQKIAYLADSFWRDQGVRSKTNMAYNYGTPGIFAQPNYAKILMAIALEKGIQPSGLLELIELKGDKRQAVFQFVAGDRKGETKVVNYDYIHVVPKHVVPDVLKRSSLLDGAGFVDVNPLTTRHKKYQNIFSVGDCSSLPTSKTAAAISAAAPVLVSNLLASLDGKTTSETYDGYTSCPLVISYSHLLLAEFKGPGYGNVMAPSFPWGQTTPTRFGFFLKKNVFPWLYWNGLLRGSWKGPGRSKVVGAIRNASDKICSIPSALKGKKAVAKQ